MENNISRLTQELSASFLKIEERRNRWHTITRAFILEQLGMVTAQYKLDWKAGVNEVWQNMESVYLMFNHSPSGIVERNAYNTMQKVKTGGLLSFSQSRNGQIIIWIAFPFIEGITDDGPKNATLETVEPEEVDEACVVRNVEKFLAEMVQWENDAREEIGFVRKHR